LVSYGFGGGAGLSQTPGCRRFEEMQLLNTHRGRCANSSPAAGASRYGARARSERRFPTPETTCPGVCWSATPPRVLLTCRKSRARTPAITSCMLAADACRRSVAGGRLGRTAISPNEPAQHLAVGRTATHVLSTSAPGFAKFGFWGAFATPRRHLYLPWPRPDIPPSAPRPHTLMEPKPCRPSPIRARCGCLRSQLVRVSSATAPTRKPAEPPSFARSGARRNRGELEHLPARNPLLPPRSGMRSWRRGGQSTACNQLANCVHWQNLRIEDPTRTSTGCTLTAAGARPIPRHVKAPVSRGGGKFTFWRPRRHGLIAIYLCSALPSPIRPTETTRRRLIH